jgi:hypothetical protein
MLASWPSVFGASGNFVANLLSERPDWVRLLADGLDLLQVNSQISRSEGQRRQTCPAYWVVCDRFDGCVCFV